jgi:hypothetical protein
MVSGGYSATTGVTSLTGLVAAGTLAKNTVITWNGLTALANTAVKRVIAGSTCTVTDDKTGPTVTVDANIGGEAGAFFVTFSEATEAGKFDGTDITVTAADEDANCADNYTVTTSSATAKRFKVVVSDDCNMDGAVTAVTAGTAAALDSIASNVLKFEASHTLKVGDKVVCASIPETADDGTYYVHTVVDADEVKLSSTYGNFGHATTGIDTFTNDGTNMAGTCTRVAELGPISLANADSIVVKTASSPAQACTTIASVANSKDITVASSTGIAVGDHIEVAGLAASGENGSYYVDSVPDGTSIVVHRAAGAFTAQAGAGGTVCEGQSGVKDASDNFGSTTTTKTLATLQHTDSVKPILTAATTCVQHTSAVISDGGTLKATSSAAAGGPLGVAGNAWRMSIVNSRGLIVPTVAVDNTALTITVTADLAYASAEDIQAAYANSGGAAWTLARVSQNANVAMGTASATTVAQKSTDSGTGDTAGAQRCTVKVTSNENIQAIADNGVSASVAINGVAQAWNGADATFGASTSDRSVASSSYFTPSLPVVDGTITITLTGTIQDTAGNTVTVLALQD